MRYKSRAVLSVAVTAPVAVTVPERRCHIGSDSEPMCPLASAGVVQNLELTEPVHAARNAISFLHARPASAAPRSDHRHGQARWPDEEDGHPRRWLILAVLAAVAFMAQLDLFIVNIAIPHMERAFPGTSLSGLSWVLNAYSIVFAALLVPAGRLAGRHGRRKFLLVGVAIFTLASVCCALAPDLGTLTAARAVQALGAALIVPTSLGLLFPSFAKRHHSRVVGIWAGVGAVAASSGPPIGGLLVAIDWRWIFLVNLPVGAVAFTAGFRVLPEMKADSTAPLPDPVSTLSLLGGVSLLVFAITEGPTMGWTRPSVVASACLAAAGFSVAVVMAQRHPHPLVEASLFRYREFAIASAALLAIFVGVGAWLLITVLFLQDMWHYSALRTGLAISPGPLVTAVFALNSGRIAARWGRVGPAAAGAVLMAISAAYWIATATGRPDYLLFLPGAVIGGAAPDSLSRPFSPRRAACPQTEQRPAARFSPCHVSWAVR